MGIHRPDDIRVLGAGEAALLLGARVAEPGLGAEVIDSGPYGASAYGNAALGE